ncbi:MAG: bifunctional 2-methylcitrate synthase/citrate synthase, partial [Amphiplicatus sp.]|nr:bifunctional 2-methylcitrate synthase/citrate synthase [Amphiplicatus sp.]
MADTEVKYGLAGVIADDTSISKVMPEINSLTYRGYKVQDLATQCRFEEVAYLIWNGELPKKDELSSFNAREKSERGLSADVLAVMKRFNKNAHPMDTLR